MDSWLATSSRLGHDAEDSAGHDFSKEEQTHSYKILQRKVA